MNIALFNVVRDIYWNDRENIELEMLKTFIKPMAHVSLITVSERMIDEMIDNSEDIKRTNACVFYLDFNADERVIDGIFRISNYVKNKNKNILTFLLGQRAFIHSGDIMKECSSIDYILGGEVEDEYGVIISKCLEQLKENDKKITNKRNNNELVCPDREEKVIKELKTAKVRTTRGCYGNCSFCIDKGCIGISKMRDMASVVNEIEQINIKYDVKKICIYDNSFEDPDYKDKKRIREFLKLVKEKNLKLYFDCSIRAESFNTEDDYKLLHEMSEIGFYKIIVGFESGNEDDLVFFNKRATVKDNLRIASFLDDCKINYVMPPGFIMFHPLSSKKSLIDNYDFLKRINKGYCMLAVCSFLKVFPESKMHFILREKELVIKDSSYKSLIDYKYANSEISEFANYLYKMRYESKAVEVGMKIDSLKNLVAQLNKGYSEWKGICELEKEVTHISNTMTEYVSCFFEECINNLNDIQYIKEKYDELEKRAKSIKVNNLIRNFVLLNHDNDEIKYLL